MVVAVVGCEDSASRCSRITRKGINLTTPVSSFFKVMIGDRFSEILLFPPKFAPIVSELIGQETLLVNSSGQQWKVRFSKVEGSTAFQEGWKAFATDNKVEFGDFVVFNYIVGSHFSVKVYDNSACEKPSVTRNQEGGAQTSKKKFIAKSDPHRMVDKGKMKKHGSNTCVLPSPDSEIRQCDPKKKSFRHKPSVAEELPLNASDDLEKNGKLSAVSDKKPCMKEIPESQCTESKWKKIKGPNNSLSLSSKKETNLDLPEELRKLRQIAEGTNKRKPMFEPKPIKVIPALGSGFLGGYNHNVYEVKRETLHIVGQSSKTAPVIPCSTVVGPQPFLKLSTPLPSYLCVDRQRKDTSIKVVLLRGLQPRMWKVLYDASVPILMSGWEAFCKVNRIQPGYCCTFDVEDELNNIYEVGIVRN